ncbi:MAG: response regulator [Kofleriaceae bacterium]
MTTILCVDDDPNVLTVLGRVLQRDGVEVRTTESPTDALAWIAHDDIAVLISDYDMPEMTGAQLCGQAKRLRPETVRVLLTGQRDLQTAVEGINQGEVFRFVSKPFDHGALREVVKAALERHRELVALSGDRAKRERAAAMREAIEREYPGITTVNRDADGHYAVPEARAFAAELGVTDLVQVLVARSNAR